MKAILALFCLFLTVVHGYRPAESDEAKNIGLNLETSKLKEFEEDVENNKPLNKYFDDLKDYLETVQENNKLLDTKSKKIVEEVKILLGIIKTDKLVTITKLDELITDFAKKSAENYYIYGHSLEWLDKRIKLNILSEKPEIIRMNDELREAKTALYAAQLIVDGKRKDISEQIRFCENYIAISGEQVYSVNALQLTNGVIQSKLNIIVNTIQKIRNGQNLSIRYIELTNQAVETITKWATQETK